MKIKNIIMLSALSAITMSSFASDGYLTDVRGEYVKNNTGLCWKTSSWTPAKAVKECDPDLVKKEDIIPSVNNIVLNNVKPIIQKQKFSADALFDFNKSTLSIMGVSKIADVALEAKELNVEVILVVGHTDRLGSEKYNDKLSLARATSVKEKLKELGVEESKIFIEGKGEKQSTLGLNACPGAKSAKVIACLAPDRRVEIELIGTKK